MSSSKNDNEPPKKKKPIQHLIGGGIAGFVESSVCHPLDTIKTRMQLRRQTTTKKEVVKRMEGKALGSMRDATGKNEGTKETVRVKPNLDAVKSSGGTPSAFHDVGWKQRVPNAAPTPAAANSVSTVKAAAEATSGPVVATLGPFGTARRIITREGPLALYKGLTAVYTGIIPKMAIRFVSFEWYRDALGGWYNHYSGLSSSTPPPSVTFTAGLLSGLTEAVVIVTPAEVCKIRMQSQYHSLMDPSQRQHAKYRNVAQTAVLIVKEEGLGALYKGVVPTMLRQGCNQAVNFTVYNWSKKVVLSWKKSKVEKSGGDSKEVTLDHWQSLVLGGLSGGMGPLVNNPLGEFVKQCECGS
jgi:predicted membrane-bound mannosyltransferase